MNERRVGRPREVEDPVPVKVLIPASVYDRLDQQARQEELSVPAIIRRLISVPEIQESAQQS